MEARIGVFICNCGNNLKNINFHWLQERSAALPGVAYATLNTALCLKDKLDSLLVTIREERLDRVVIAACSPQLNRQTFSQTMEQSGLSPDLLAWVNLREQCSWAHRDDVSEKALSLVRMAVNEATLLRPVKLVEVPISHRTLIIGGGFSGLTVAAELSRLGLRSIIVEKGPGLGGSFQGKGILEPALREKLAKLVAEATSNSYIEVMTSAEVTSVDGTAGNFRVRINTERQTSQQRSFGAIVVAVGRQAGPLPEPAATRVVAYPDIARLEHELERFPKRVAFLVDAADEHSRIRTLAALAGAIVVREKLSAEAYIFARNLKVDSRGAEKLYREAREKGVTLVKFDGDPEVTTENGRVKIKARDVLLDDEVTVDCDLLVTGGEEHISPQLSATLGIGTDGAGFYQTVNPHLFPSPSERKGVWLAGGCRADLDMTRAGLEATQTAFKVYELLSQECGRAKARVSVDADKCRACLTCLRVCPHGAIQMEHLSGKEKARIHDIACDACGVCVAICPAKAIEHEGYSDAQIFAQLKAIGAP